MNKRDSARILALGCHPVHTYSCLFALAAPWWHLEHLFRPAPCVLFCNSPLVRHLHIRSYVPIAPRRRLPAWLPAADAIAVKTWNAPEIYVEFAEVLYAAESRAPRFLTLFSSLTLSLSCYHRSFHRSYVKRGH